MSERLKKTINNTSRAKRTRTHIKTTAGRPRLSVHISNLHVSAQIIDDEKSVTLASATSVGMKTTTNMTDKAEKVGEAIAKAAKSKKVSSVVFDRGAKKYHGRIKVLAEAARKNGLEF
jgi:large subunit ribosomal protein L18